MRETDAGDVFFLERVDLLEVGVLVLATASAREVELTTVLVSEKQDRSVPVTLKISRRLTVATPFPHCCSHS
jgi:hypothetical protein